MSARGLSDWLAHAGQVHPVGIDLGLHRVAEVAHRLGVLRPAAKNVVIAGTNGKGSTSVYLEALLRAGGRSVGTTLSPHLNRFNERVRVNGVPVGDIALCDAYATIEAARREITLTYFEFGVLAALLIFRRANVDATVLEVGLGGRLDAVNLVDGSVTVITSIGIDHVAYLGPDRESIGAEKAGILRRDVPCVYGEDSIPTSIVTAAETLGAPLLRYGQHFDARSSTSGWDFEGTCMGDRLRVCGLAWPSVALRNASIALQALLALDGRAAVRDCVGAARDARLPGRFEQFTYRDVSVFIDVAHNPHGAAFLSEQLSASEKQGRTIAVAGFLQDKDAAGIVAALDSAVDEWMFVGTGGERGQDAAASARKVGGIVDASVADIDLRDLLDRLVARLNARDRIVVLGCFDVAQRARAIVNPEGDAA